MKYIICTYILINILLLPLFGQQSKLDYIDYKDSIEKATFSEFVKNYNCTENGYYFENDFYPQYYCGVKIELDENEVLQTTKTNSFDSLLRVKVNIEKLDPAKKIAEIKSIIELYENTGEIDVKSCLRYIKYYEYLIEQQKILPDTNKKNLYDITSIEYIKRYNSPELDSVFFINIAKYCPNLQIIKISSLITSEFISFKYINESKNITTLILKHISDYDFTKVYEEEFERRITYIEIKNFIENLNLLNKLNSIQIESSSSAIEPTYWYPIIPICFYDSKIYSKIPNQNYLNYKVIPKYNSYDSFKKDYFSNNAIYKNIIEHNFFNIYGYYNAYLKLNYTDNFYFSNLLDSLFKNTSSNDTASFYFESNNLSLNKWIKGKMHNGNIVGMYFVGDKRMLDSTRKNDENCIEYETFNRYCNYYAAFSNIVLSMQFTSPKIYNLYINCFKQKPYDREKAWAIICYYYDNFKTDFKVDFNDKDIIKYKSKKITDFSVDYLINIEKGEIKSYKYPHIFNEKDYLGEKNESINFNHISTNFPGKTISFYDDNIVNKTKYNRKGNVELLGYRSYNWTPINIEWIIQDKESQKVFSVEMIYGDNSNNNSKDIYKSDDSFYGNPIVKDHLILDTIPLRNNTNKIYSTLVKLEDDTNFKYITLLAITKDSIEFKIESNEDLKLFKKNKNIIKYIALSADTYYEWNNKFELVKMYTLNNKYSKENKTIKKVEDIGIQFFNISDLSNLFNNYKRD